MDRFDLFGLEFNKDGFSEHYCSYRNNLGFEVLVVKGIEYIIVELRNINYPSTVQFRLQHSVVAILESDLDILRDESCLYYLINCKKKAEKEFEILRSKANLHSHVISLDLKKYEILL